MIELCAQWYAAAIQALGLMPMAPVALLLSSLASLRLTQWIKFMLRPELSEPARHRASQAIAFVCAFIPALVLLLQIGQQMAVMWAAICGLWTPAAWRAAMLFVRRWSPELADRLSQDVRE